MVDAVVRDSIKDGISSEDEAPIFHIGGNARLLNVHVDKFPCEVLFTDPDG